MRGGGRGNVFPAPAEPAGREDRAGEVLAGWWEREGTPFRLSPPWLPAAEVEKSCAWNRNWPGSRRKPNLSPPLAGFDRRTGPGRCLAPGSARLVPRPGATPWSPPRGLVCGVWVTPATDVSCFSDLGCIFVGSSGIGGAG